jgi:hypothetical protein
MFMQITAELLNGGMEELDFRHKLCRVRLDGPVLEVHARQILSSKNSATF